MASDDTTNGLLSLPDHCLLAVMQCCADDTRSMLSAATASSTLQQAAVEALSSITLGPRAKQARVDSLLLYLAKHGQYVRSLVLRCAYYPVEVQLRALPPSLTMLDSLQLEGMSLQLQHDSGGAQGVLRPEFPLTRLELSESSLLDGAQGLEAALMQLPDLQQLSVRFVSDEHDKAKDLFPTAVLAHLTNLTFLNLKDEGSGSSSDVRAALGSLQALTRLVDLELDLSFNDPCRLDASMLSGAVQLTRLVASRDVEPRVLAGKTQLQHLSLTYCIQDDAAATTQLLSELQHLKHLTHLNLADSCCWEGYLGGPSPPPAAYASLTASSRLQHLDFRDNTLPAAAWQYMCPPGRVLPQLQHLDISGVREANGSLTLPNTSALVSCCPGLQSLRSSMPCSTAQLAPLRRLTGLQHLAVGAGEDDELEGVQALCQLTRLHELELFVPWAAKARTLQLTKLTWLTALCFERRTAAMRKELRCDPQDPASEPVRRQLLRLLLKSRDRQVAKQAAAALEAT